MTAATTRLRKVRALVLAHYKKYGRHDLPWRHTTDPYKILVSEVMLQQTQVHRVIPKYNDFIHKYPTASALAQAPLAHVLSTWTGLGYNRRAKYLQQAAKAFPEGPAFGKGRAFSTQELQALPGVGPYTARAVCVFAYNQPEVLIETNVRAVVLHHFYPKSHKVPDVKISKIAEQLMPARTDPRVWYAALFDYGSYLKTIHPNPARRAKAHAKQKTFKGSDREIRGTIIRTLTNGASTLTNLPFDRMRVAQQASALMHEGLITRNGKKFILSQ